MTIILNGIKNFLSFINENWTLIMVCVGLGIAAYKKIKNFLELNDEEKIDVAKSQAKEVILKFVSDAEYDYAEWNKAGSIKRAQVIDEIFDKYPILSKVANQNTIIKWIDTEIDNALIILREVIEENFKDEEITKTTKPNN